MKKITEEELCQDCFKVVSVPSRYKLIKYLARSKSGMSVGEIAIKLSLSQPTITHHLGILKSLECVSSEKVGRSKIYKINRKAHCFEECLIPLS